MCGIGGISLASGSQFPVKHFMHELLLLSEERGRVASGWAYNEGPKFGHFKQPIPGGRLKTKSVPDQASSVILHTRNSTTGDPQVAANNHPVISDSGDIMLIHNGVVSNHDLIKKHKDTPKLADVDTSVLPWLLESFGLAGLSEADGWAAIAWLDKQTPGVVHLARLNKAPLVLAQLKDGSMVFGSTYPILEGALKRVGRLDQVSWMYEVGEWTYIQLKDGKQVYFESLPAFSAAASSFKPAVKLTWAQEQAKKKQEAEQLAITEGKAPASSGSTLPTQPTPTSTPTVKGASTTGATPSTKSGGSTPSTGGTSASTTAKAGSSPSLQVGGSATGSSYSSVIAELEAEYNEDKRAEEAHVYDEDSFEARMAAAIGGKKSSEQKSAGGGGGVTFHTPIRKSVGYTSPYKGVSKLNALPGGQKKQDSKHRYYFEGQYYDRPHAELAAEKAAVEAQRAQSPFFSEAYGQDLYFPGDKDALVDYWVEVRTPQGHAMVMNSDDGDGVDTWFEFMETVHAFSEEKILIDYGMYTPWDKTQSGAPKRISFPLSWPKANVGEMALELEDYYDRIVGPAMKKFVEDADKAIADEDAERLGPVGSEVLPLFTSAEVKK